MSAIPGLPPETRTFSNIVWTYDTRLQLYSTKHSPTSAYKTFMSPPVRFGPCYQLHLLGGRYDPSFAHKQSRIFFFFVEITQISDKCKFYLSWVAWKHVMWVVMLIVIYWLICACPEEYAKIVKRTGVKDFMINLHSYFLSQAKAWTCLHCC